jgi:hypothetical protein
LFCHHLLRHKWITLRKWRLPAEEDIISHRGDKEVHRPAEVTLPGGKKVVGVTTWMR